jgi:hypothetical protein
MFSVGRAGFAGWMVTEVGVPLEGVRTVTVPFTFRSNFALACATGLAIATADEAKTLAKLSAMTAPYFATLGVRVFMVPLFVSTA